MKRARVYLTPPDHREWHSNCLWGGMLVGAIVPIALFWLAGSNLEESGLWALFSLVGAVVVPIVATTWFDARYCTND